MYADAYIGIAEELSSHCIRGPWFFHLLCQLCQMFAMNAKDQKASWAGPTGSILYLRDRLGLPAIDIGILGSLYRKYC